jgi:hypothetical protein
MEEKMKSPGGFFDKDKLLVDREVADFFGGDEVAQEIYTHPYTDNTGTGYIRYIIEGRKVIILDCVATSHRTSSF